jgi:hypothetical protein
MGVALARENRLLALMLALVQPEWLFLAVCMFLFAGGGYAAVRSAQRTLTRMRAFAERHGLQAAERSALGFTWIESMEGVQSGRKLRYWTYTTGSGKSRVTWSAVGVEPRADGGLEFEITQQHFGSKILEFFGAKEIQVGDPVFDAAWFVRTNQPEFFAAALVPSIREQMMAAPGKTRSGQYKLADGRVRYAEKGSWSQAGVLERLEQQVPLLQALADVAEVAAETSR